jgi:4-amino-4-deoxy-L-arabinose transferase-like glycosyltransferase
MIILLGCLLGWLLYLWGKEIYGYKGALFALFLYAFNPNIITHSSLTTIDIGASCMIFLSIYCLWKYLKKGDCYSIIMAGGALGLAQLSKFTALQSR